MRITLLAAAAVLAAAGCGQDDPGTIVLFDLDGAIDEPKTFFDHPFPSDLRLGADGKPDLTGFPNPKRIEIIDDLLITARDRDRWPTMPVGYFQFTGELAPRSPDDVIAAEPSSPILLVNIDPDSPDRGRLYPTIALSLIIDDYVREPTLAVAPRQGFVLDGDTTYAFVVMRDAGDVDGNRLGVAPAIRSLARGKTPSGALGDQARELFAPLWPTLEMIGADPAEVAAATVFTTADVVADLFALTEALREEYTVTLDGLALDSDDGADHDRYCELLATVDYPQFQRGTPPFDSEGLFEIGADGLPIMQRTETAPVVVTIPKGEMPADGYPLLLYFHGSGGYSSQVVDRGTVEVVGGAPRVGEGPAFVVAEHGIAAAGSALPVNPERVPGATDIEYLNFSNLAAFRDLFRQGVIEQRLFLDALLDLEIDPATLAGCTGPTLPNGATAFKFDPNKVVALGQSMGGMYTNLISPVEPRIRAAVPTGAGGFWHYFILQTSLVDGARSLLAVILGTPEPDLTFMHPGMHLLGLAWEPSEPVVSMPRIGHNPLPGHPVRPIYEPVGKGDEYFPIQLYDAVVLAYGHQQAGELVWPSMQDALALAGLDGIIDYPVIDNLPSRAGGNYTGVVVQYEGDGIRDPHVIFAQLDEVKYQYGCFLATFLDTGTAVVPAPAALGTPCPTE
jgi:hypothetical protein